MLYYILVWLFIVPVWSSAQTKNSKVLFVLNDLASYGDETHNNSDCCNATLGGILFSTGSIGNTRDIIFDPEQKITCLIEELSVHFLGPAAGSIITNRNGEKVPVICGGRNPGDNCHIYDIGLQKWTRGVPLGTHMRVSNYMVSLGKWLFLSGGWENSPNTGLSDETVIANEDELIIGPRMEKGKRRHCAAVIKEDLTSKTIAVLGGFDEATKGLKDMEIFSCNIESEPPTCVKKDNGPMMKTTHVNFGCGVIQCQNGRRTLLAMKDELVAAGFGESKSEALDLDDEKAQWKELKDDFAKYDAISGRYSLIISQDPTKAYLNPINRYNDDNKVYEVTCKNSNDFSFLRINGSTKGGRYSLYRRDYVTVSLPDNHGIKNVFCDCQRDPCPQQSTKA